MTLDHVGIVVRSIDAAARLYGAAFGLRIAERYELPVEGVRLAFLPSGPVLVELLEPIGDAGSIAKFLSTRGPGLHHIAFRVSDITAALHEASEAGCTPVDPAPRPGARGHMIAFLHPSTAGGVLIELVQA